MISISDYIQIATLIVVTVYTIVTYKLFSSQNKQSFENKFFKLLTLHHEIVNSIEGMAIDGIQRGRKNFVTFYAIFCEKYESQSQINPKGDPLTMITDSYKEFFKFYQPDIGHYFRNLYHMIKFIDKSSSNEKDFFTHLVRAQLSSHELLLLFYNCLSPNGNEKFKPLVEKYSLLENMPEDELLDKKLKLPYEHKNLYKEIAFKKDIK